MRVLSLLVAILILAPGLEARQADGKPATVKSQPDSYSGMYSFLRDGEFVQVSVEDQGKVSGFVSRFGDLDSDKGAFLDHFFKEGKLDGMHLSFTTEPVHGVWFAFKGVVDRGEGRNRNEEAYYVLKGTLTEYSSDQNKKSFTRSREVIFKSFPQEIAPDSSKND